MERGYMVRQVHMSGAKCALDLGDGSERGEYVCQDYILNALGRPHRAVNIMFTFYPKDKQWPKRISKACADMDVKFAWDYPYDDYYPFSEDGDQFEQMKDIRRHGQEVMLTVTMDCSLDDETIRSFAKKLVPFGRLMLRINHECNGDWFTHNKRFSYEEVAAFFVRAAGIIKEAAPNVRLVFCAGLAGETDEAFAAKKSIIRNYDEEFEKKTPLDVVELEDVFADAYRTADIWSADKYLALHFGWPYDIAEPGSYSYTFDDPDAMFERYKRTYKRLSDLFGEKPFIQAELNADGDVTGPLHQAESVLKYYASVKRDGRFLAGISMYQFRDRGRLGLEIEDPNNSAVGIKQPLLDEYKKVLSDPYFQPQITAKDEMQFPAQLRWGGSEDADGIEIMFSFEKTPQFCEVVLQKDLCLMMEFGGRWFYKKCGVERIDLMPLFFDRPLSGKSDIPLRIFATPPDGVNEENGRDDWRTDQYYTMESAPQFRICYETPQMIV